MFLPVISIIELGRHTEFLVLGFLLSELIHSLSFRDIYAIVYHMISVQTSNTIVDQRAGLLPPSKVYY
jgi:hypothetical protein